MMNIAALLSGGVDSSVVVHLLCEQGYKPTLFYIKIGMDGAEYMDCSAEEDIEMSTAIARKYGLSLEVVDLHKEYWENVAAYAIDKIKKGLTPNPDVMCNKLIKFGCFEQQVERISILRRQGITPPPSGRTARRGLEQPKTLLKTRRISWPR